MRTWWSSSVVGGLVEESRLADWSLIVWLERGKTSEKRTLDDGYGGRWADVEAVDVVCAWIVVVVVEGDDEGKAWTSVEETLQVNFGSKRSQGLHAKILPILGSPLM